MSARRMAAGRVVGARWALLLSALLPAAATAQEAPKDAQPAPSEGFFDQVLQTGCSSCAGGVLGPKPEYFYDGVPAGPVGGCGDGCGEGGCFPGRQPCAPCCGQNYLSRMFCAFHDCLCCPDPCYEPRWIGAANAALFVDGARPVSQTRLRWDAGRDLIFPDRAEYFWARIGQRGPKNPERRVNYNELSMYTEAAVEKFAVTFDMPYRSLDPLDNPGGAGFGNLMIGMKSMFIDCELVQLTFQMNTYIPTGSPGKGVSNGHVSLEPSLLAAIKLYPETYFQAQLSQWIPIGGSPGFQGGIFHYHMSFNHVVARPVADMQLVGTLELNGYCFQSGAYTDPFAGPQEANGYNYLSIGPGIRCIMCDKVDLGFGAAFAVTRQHFADQLFRTELRWRF